MTIGAKPAAWHYIFSGFDPGDQLLTAGRTVGGSATPAARMARLAAGRGAERTVKRLPSCSISVSVSALRSAMMSVQDAARLSAAILSSNAFFNTRARKLQNT